MNEPSDRDVVAELRARAEAVQPDGPFDELAVLRRGRRRLAARRGSAGALVLTVAAVGVLGVASWDGQLGSMLRGARSTQTGTPSDAWDPHTWTPTETITRATMSEQTKEARRAEQLAGMAKDLDLTDPPQVGLVRWTEGLTDHAAATATCLTDAGFETDVWTGTTGVSQVDAPARDLAAYICEAKYTLDPALAGDWTPAQLNLLYDYWTQFYVPCLQAHGAEVSTTEWPEKAGWVRAWNRPDRDTWWPPDDLLAGLPEQEQAALTTACAPYPPDDVLFGR
ncbi:MAG: hypothetical protein KQH57_17570 [Actinomycetales bacterium]|nr:hypothetical protein [Actinomycetales bacterium]